MRLSTRKLELAPNIPWRIVGPVSMRTLTRVFYMPNSGNTPPTPLTPPSPNRPAPWTHAATWHMTPRYSANKVCLPSYIIINAAIGHGHSENLDFPMYLLITRNNTKHISNNNKKFSQRKQFFTMRFLIYNFTIDFPLV